APESIRPSLELLASLGKRLESEELAKVFTYFGKRGEVTLLPLLQPDNAGLVTIWKWTDGKALVTPWRSVFERRAPDSIERFELASSPAPLGQGNEIVESTDSLVEAIYQAYLEARGGHQPA